MSDYSNAVFAGHTAYRHAVEMDRIPFGDALSVGMEAAINHALADAGDPDFDKLLEAINNLRGHRCNGQTHYLAHVDAVYAEACRLARAVEGKE